MAGRKAVVIDPMWTGCQEDNFAIRSMLQNAGMLSATEHTATVLDPLSFTEAHRSQPRFFEEGHVIEFTRKTDSFDRGTRLTVVDSANGMLTVRDADGSQFPFDPSKASKHFAVFQERPMPVASKDRLLLVRANGKSARWPQAHQWRTGGR